MISWGINALNHGSSLAVFENDKLLVNKFDVSDELTPSTIKIALDFGQPDHIFWYENPWLKKARQFRAGQFSRCFDLAVLPKKYLANIGLRYNKLTYTQHHASHAAAGYYTSPFDSCVVVVLDAIGEFECASIWVAEKSKLTKVWHKNYPNSLGLFYSAFTDLIGLTPVREEYKLQALSQYGDPSVYYNAVKKYIGNNLTLNYNLHRGIRDWPYELNDVNKQHIAAAVQEIFEQQILDVMQLTNKFTNTKNLVYMGGCAMNSHANKKIVEPMFDKIWSLPQPGDPSSSIGAVLYHRQHKISPNNFDVVKHIEIKV